MGMRDRLRRLEQSAQGEIIEIPLKDGSVKRFPASEGVVAFVNLFDRLGAGENAPPEHPLIAAARDSTDPTWFGSFFAVNDPEKWIQPLEDLSEK